jgi:thiol-disulfide isomerase/thioredoxin
VAKRSQGSALQDLSAGLVAVAVVVGGGFVSPRVGSDFRGMFALTSAAFFLAGLARGGTPAGNLLWKTILVSLGGILGTATLLMNNGMHRLFMPAGLGVIAIAASAAGLYARRCWRGARLRSLAFAVLSAGALAAVSLFLVPALSTYSAFEELDRVPAPFILTSNGHAIDSDAFYGRVTVLAFWASWCLPCSKELPEIQTVYERFQANSRVKFYAVDMGWNDETAEVGKAFLARHNLTLPFAFDAGPAAKSLGVDAIPTVILMDTKGRTRYVHHGYDTSESLAAALSVKIEQLLSRP